MVVISLKRLVLAMSTAMATSLIESAEPRMTWNLLAWSLQEHSIVKLPRKLLTGQALRQFLEKQKQDESVTAI